MGGAATPRRAGIALAGRAARVQRRRRRLAGLVRFAVFLLLIFIAVWAGVRVAHAGEDGSVYTGHQYTVRSGDTCGRSPPASTATAPTCAKPSTRSVRSTSSPVRTSSRGRASPCRISGTRSSAVARGRARSRTGPRGRALYLRRVRDVAQPGSAPALGAGGREFKSCRPDQYLPGGSSSVGRASAFQAEGRGFETRLPLHLGPAANATSVLACVAPRRILAFWCARSSVG